MRVFTAAFYGGIMVEQAKKPVIVLAFANDNDDYLQMVVRERKSIYKSLQDLRDNNCVQVEAEPNTTIEDIFTFFSDYNERIAIFHYGGHASGTHLQLESSPGEAKPAGAGGLAALMGQQKNLKLVFLNGCATHDQVKLLLDAGVKAVIATSVPINDEMATEFAEQFYQALANKSDILKAFNTAKAFVTANYEKPREIGEFRGASWKGKASKKDEVPWGLYLAEDPGDVAEWKLPQTPVQNIIVQETGSATPASPGKATNNDLIEVLSNEIAKYSKESRILIDAYKKSGRYDLRMLRGLVIDSFPVPIGEQLRKILTGRDPADSDANGNAAEQVQKLKQRIRQLVVTYETTVQLCCFTVVSQLWDVIYANPKIKAEKETLAVLQKFFALDEPGYRTFCYIDLIAGAIRILNNHQIEPFIKEIAVLDDIMRGEQFCQSYQKLEKLRANIPADQQDAAALTALYQQTMTELGNVMQAFTFLVKYKLTTIKQIEIIKGRHKDPSFRHRQVVLDRISDGMMDDTGVYPSFTDSQSVILLENVKDVAHYLSLSPLVIDVNALTGHENSKLYFYCFPKPTENAYQYKFVDNEADTLLISDSQFPQIKQELEDLRDALLGARQIS